MQSRAISQAGPQDGHGSGSTSERIGWTTPRREWPFPDGSRRSGGGQPLALVADMGEDSSPRVHLELKGEGQALCPPALRSSVSLLRVPFDRKNLETIRLPKLTKLDTSPIPSPIPCNAPRSGASHGRVGDGGRTASRRTLPGTTDSAGLPYTARPPARPERHPAPWPVVNSITVAAAPARGGTHLPRNCCNWKRTP